jgi:hypothetical protein
MPPLTRKVAIAIAIFSGGGADADGVQINHFELPQAV